MRFAVTHTRAIVGIKAQRVMVEAHLSRGLTAFALVGLPEASVKESRHRVRSAILNSRFDFPSGRITVNLAPAALPKEGAGFDLAIALAILAASGQLDPRTLFGYEFVAELALDGQLRASVGALAIALAVQKEAARLVMAESDALIGAKVPSVDIYGAPDLLAVCAHLKGYAVLPVATPVTTTQHDVVSVDLASVSGQPQAKRALEIAAAGGHALLMTGRPGVGKTMLAQCLPGILPPLPFDQALEVETIYALSDKGRQSDFQSGRPFRAPHHTASTVALVGGGRCASPGEISLAHHGVLFLDELPEFKRAAIESLRQPLELGLIKVARAEYTICYPARFQLIAAMNPCPCGYLGDPTILCRCSSDQVARYQEKISGPVRDRIDLSVVMEYMSLQHQIKSSATEPSAVVKERVARAQNIQFVRQKGLNSTMSQQQFEQVVHLSGQDKNYLTQVLDREGLSMRSFRRISTVARTIADLQEAAAVTRTHLEEALSYRMMGFAR